MEIRYGRISGKEAVVGVAIDAAIEGATTVAGGAALKGAGKGIAKTYKFGASKFSGMLLKSKSARMARFGENLKRAYSVSTRQANREVAMIGRVEKVAIGNEQVDSFVRDASVSMNTALRQRTALAFEEAGILNGNGELTAQAIKESTYIPLSSREIRNESVKKVLLRDGSIVNPKNNVTNE